MNELEKNSQGVIAGEAQNYTGIGHGRRETTREETA